MASLPQDADQHVARHYTHGSLLETILDAIRKTGLDPEHLSADDLSPVDEFHTGGRGATVELADQMGVVPGMRLLDIGSGLGGPSRYFAAHRGCNVTGIDLSTEFCNTATALSARTGLSGQTSYRQASAVSLPFEDQAFDGAYMLHVGMNIADKAGVFRQAARVLKRGAVFAIFDMMRAGAGDLNFPVPWASSPEASFVDTEAVYTELLREAGFEIAARRDRRDFAIAFFTKMRAAAASGTPPPLSLMILMGPSISVKVGNLMEMIERRLLAPTEIFARKL